ncbi:MAG: hypothetical protein P8J33_04175, partial [Pirellulaceae bacterium]|nr:hypothetical protein [Pirellulaceae bacterium]
SGANWENVTPPQLPEWTQINSIEIHPTKKGGLYVAGTRYKADDYKPYLLKTMDYGKTWTSITKGIDPAHFTRVIRADPQREGLLYAGTERGVYVSLNDGESWEPFQLNLPIVPVTDLALKDNDLIVATQGRSFWVLDDLTLLHQWNDKHVKEDLHLFASRPVYRGLSGGRGRASATAGANPPAGVPIQFWLRDVPEGTEASLEIKDTKGTLVKRYATKPDKNKDEEKLNLKSGMNTVRWNTRYAGAETFDGMVLWAGGTQGPSAMPGAYTAEIVTADATQKVDFEILKDPRLEVTGEEYQKQFDFLIGIRDKLTKTHLAIKKIRDVREQIKTLKSRLKDDEQYADLIKQADEIVQRMTKIEETLYQTKSRSGQDPLNFPIRLNNRLSRLVSVVSSADGPPTRQAVEVHDLVVAEIDKQLAELQVVFDEEVQQFNNAIQAQKVPFIFAADD